LLPIMSVDIKLSVLFLPVSVVIIFIFTAGFCLIFSTLNVFFRDISHIIDVLFQAWFYTTPIIYPLKMVPERFKIFFKLNPMYYVISCFKMPLYNGVIPDMNILLISFLSSVIVFVFGWWLFNKLENNFIHYI
jgi:ABC-2 type transport system permease protein